VLALAIGKVYGAAVALIVPSPEIVTLLPCLTPPNTLALAIGIADNLFFFFFTRVEIYYLYTHTNRKLLHKISHPTVHSRQSNKNGKAI
jgi:hypothetical protein